MIANLKINSKRKKKKNAGDHRQKQLPDEDDGLRAKT